MLADEPNNIIFYISIINHRTPSGGLIIFICHRHVGSYFITSTKAEFTHHTVYTRYRHVARGPTIFCRELWKRNTTLGIISSRQCTSVWNSSDNTSWLVITVVFEIKKQFTLQQIVLSFYHRFLHWLQQTNNKNVIVSSQSKWIILYFVK